MKERAYSDEEDAYNSIHKKFTNNFKAHTEWCSIHYANLSITNPSITPLLMMCLVNQLIEDDLKECK